MIEDVLRIALAITLCIGGLFLLDPDVPLHRVWLGTTLITVAGQLSWVATS